MVQRVQEELRSDEKALRQKPRSGIPEVDALRIQELEQVGTYFGRFLDWAVLH